MHALCIEQFNEKIISQKKLIMSRKIMSRKLTWFTTTTFDQIIISLAIKSLTSIENDFNLKMIIFCLKSKGDYFIRNY